MTVNRYRIAFGPVSQMWGLYRDGAFLGCFGTRYEAEIARDLHMRTQRVA